MMRESLGWVLVHSLWQFALLALLAGVLVRLMHRQAASARYIVLATGMAAMAAAPVLTWIVQPNGFSVRSHSTGAERWDPAPEIEPTRPDIDTSAAFQHQ